MHSEPWQIPWSRVTPHHPAPGLRVPPELGEPVYKGNSLERTAAGWEHPLKRGSARSTQAVAKGPGSLWGCVRSQGDGKLRDDGLQWLLIVGASGKDRKQLNVVHRASCNSGGSFCPSTLGYNPVPLKGASRSPVLF